MCLIGEAQLSSQYIAHTSTFLCGWPCIQCCIGGQSQHLEGPAVVVLGTDVGDDAVNGVWDVATVVAQEAWIVVT